MEMRPVAEKIKDKDKDKEKKETKKKGKRLRELSRAMCRLIDTRGKENVEGGTCAQGQGLSGVQCGAARTAARQSQSFPWTGMMAFSPLAHTRAKLNSQALPPGEGRGRGFGGCFIFCHPSQVQI